MTDTRQRPDWAAGESRAALRQILGLSLVLALTIGVGCTSTRHRVPVPKALISQAEIPGIPGARSWGDAPPVKVRTWLTASPEELQQGYEGIMGVEHAYLAISGGGSNGAFTAGLLSGWTAHGDRPAFTIVTGISTGALIAPLAFLGADYDERLQEMYTTYSSKDVYKRRGVFKILTGDAAVGTGPLRKLIARYIDREVFDAIAAEYRRGRRLLIGTTNLDVSRPVIWDIGVIASSNRPDALELVQKILLASASIPVAFPPVYFTVEVKGQAYDEMHVDGGTTTQIFVYPAGLEWNAVIDKLGVKGSPKVYLIRNSVVTPEWEEVKPRLIPIAARSVSSLIRTQGIGDLHRIYLATQRDQLDFNLAYIPESFDLQPTEAFDPVYMKALFDLGYSMAAEGFPWRKAPPEFDHLDE